MVKISDSQCDLFIRYFQFFCEMLKDDKGSKNANTRRLSKKTIAYLRTQKTKSKEY